MKVTVDNTDYEVTEDSPEEVRMLVGLMNTSNNSLQLLEHITNCVSAVHTADMTALEQLEMWLMYQRHWCEHKPSVTINVKSDEWFEVGAFVYKHFDEMSGVSFLPFNEHTYQQAPYQECTKEDYYNMIDASPLKIEWDKLAEYEQEDNTSGMQTMACTGDVCEMVDIT